MYKFLAVILISWPLIVLSQDSGSIKEEAPLPTADTGILPDSVGGSAIEPRPSVVPGVSAKVPLPTTLPTFTITPSPTAEPASVDLAEKSSSGDLFYFLAGVITFGIFGGGIFLRLKNKAKNNKKDEDRCGNIRELLEKKKQELEEYIHSLPEEKIKEIIGGKVSEQLKKDDNIRKVLETIEGAKDRYDKFKEAIELLEKDYSLCMLELPSVGGGDSYLSFLMAGKDIKDEQLKELGIDIIGSDSEGDRKLKIPEKSLGKYIEIIKKNLALGFWNEIVGEKDIIFIFRFKDGNFKELKLSPETESEISRLCAQFNNDSLEKTANVYKYISGNEYYRNFMEKNYKNMMSR